MTLDVGFIGLGNIGKPCAKHLIREGFVAHVFDIEPSHVQELSKQGAMAAETISEQPVWYAKRVYQLSTLRKFGH